MARIIKRFKLKNKKKKKVILSKRNGKKRKSRREDIRIPTTYK